MEHIYDGNPETAIRRTPKLESTPDIGELYMAPEYFCSDATRIVLADTSDNFTVTLYPERRVSLITYEIHGIRNLERASGIYGALSGVSVKHDLAGEYNVESHIEEEESTIGFVADVTDGKVTGKFYVLGCGFTCSEIKEYKNKHLFKVYVMNKKGNYVGASVDVTDQILCEAFYGKVADRHLVINLDVEVPEEGQGGADSPFEPDADEWEDVEVDIPV